MSIILISVHAASLPENQWLYLDLPISVSIPLSISMAVSRSNLSISIAISRSTYIYNIFLKKVVIDSSQFRAMNIVRKMEHLQWVKAETACVFQSREEKVAWWPCTTWKAYKKDGLVVLTRAFSNRARGNRFKLKEGRVW